MADNCNYVKIHKDISLIKQKKVFGLTKRQLICFGIGLGVGLPVFFLVKFLISDLTMAIVAMGIVSAPAIIAGLYEENGLHFENVIKLMYQYFRNPKIRTYQTENVYTIIERQLEYDRLNKLLRSTGNANKAVKKNWRKKFNLQKKK